MSQGLGIYNTLLLPCGRSLLLQRRGRVFACRSSDLGSISAGTGKIFSPHVGRQFVTGYGFEEPVISTTDVVIYLIY